MSHATFDTPSASWERLHETLENHHIALFLGAGVSYPNRVPDWGGFVAGLGRWSNGEMRKLRDSGMSLTSLCEIVQQGVSEADWIARVRGAIYDGFVSQVLEHRGHGLSLADFDSKDPAACARVSEFFRETNAVLREIVRVCGFKHDDGAYEMNDQIGAVLSTNIDGLPQICDRAIHGSPRMLRTVERASAETDADKVPLYQLHGYLLPPHVSPTSSGEAADGLVLTEADYVARTDDPYSWANVTLHWAVREFPLVFIGCSMSDELIRRALHRNCRERSKHYAAKHGGREIEESKRRRHFVVLRLSEDDFVNRAKNESAAMLGVWPLWVEDYDCDLPKRIRMAAGE